MMRDGFVWRKGARAAVCAMLGASAALLTGCVYVRLLALKNQLAEFDTYVQVEHAPALTFIMKEPVLLDEDVILLIGKMPTAVTTNANLVTWDYAYVNVAAPRPAPGAAPPPDAFHLVMQFRDGLLYSMVAPGQIVDLWGEDFLSAAARSLGRARIVTRSYNMKWSGIFPAGKAPPVPTQADMARLLGPARRTQDGRKERVVEYEYGILPLGPDDSDGGRIRSTFRFLSADGRMAHATLQIGRSRIAVQGVDAP